MLRFASIAAIALMAAACMPPADEMVSPDDTAAPETSAPESASPETASPATGGTGAMPQTEARLMAPDGAALHALLLAEEDNIVPSDWHTGEPAGAQYWDFPDTLDGFDVSSECDGDGDDQSAMDCTLTIAEPEGTEGGARRVMYRVQVGYTPDGSLELLDPNVRWATMG